VPNRVREWPLTDAGAREAVAAQLAKETSGLSDIGRDGVLNEEIKETHASGADTNPGGPDRFSLSRRIESRIQWRWIKTATPCLCPSIGRSVRICLMRFGFPAPQQ
jgi:hypothetical protein